MNGASPGVAICVVEADGLSYEADVLVLKHAQAPYGLDALAVERTGINLDALPRLDAIRVVRKPRGIAAEVLIFIGVRPIGSFSYDDVRRFGRMAVASVASTVPDAIEIALTLHGIGFGLDELECFDSEVAGIRDAIEADEAPRSLEVVSFLEINPGRAQRLRGRLAAKAGANTRVLPGERPSGIGGSVAPHGDKGTRKVKAHAFVAMPFDDAFSDLFHYGVSPAVHASGLLCEGMNRQAFTGDILQRLKDQIRDATIVVADLTGANANVFLEVGFAWGSKVPTVLICREGTALMFDVQGQRCLFYKSIRDLEGKLASELSELRAASPARESGRPGGIVG